MSDTKKDSTSTIQNTQKKNEKSWKNNWIVSIIFEFLALFAKKNPDVIKAKAEVKAELADDIAENKGKAKVNELEAKEQQKITKRITKAKKGFPVERLKVGKLVYINIPGDSKKLKEAFYEYDDKFVYTNGGDRKHAYGKVFTWQGKPVLKPAEDE